MPKSYLITGGAGFIGLTFTKMMLKETDAQITVLDNLTYASRPLEIEALKKNGRFRFIKGDISKKEDIDKVFSQMYDAVIHFAAESHVDKKHKSGRAVHHNKCNGHIPTGGRSVTGKSRQADSHFHR